MFHLTRARQSARSAGEPLKDVWETLSAGTVRFRRSQLHMVASGPGVGKSALALALAIRSGSSGLYFSADSDEITQAARAASMITGDPILEVQKDLRSGKYDQTLNQVSNLRFIFDPALTLDSIEETVLCYADLWGKWPEIIVVDNLLNITSDGDGEGYQADESILSYLHELARTTQACVVVLHHVTGQYDSGTEPVPLSGLRNKVSKLPVLVLTLFRNEDEMGTEALGVAVVKNRFGKASAGGSLVYSLRCDLGRMDISDLEGGVNTDEWPSLQGEGL
ncbi:DnaB-like helicase C-terminal domain-containing protein [Nocardiopsis sp. NPDC049922]|uniref:DnaB-like helicase C-terminal domain-containing protein n=1 Tax=Nocardiopsis sp. NPDC049922 TaxID=3155157 RepID=UPI0033E7AE89